jgi:hypothetical protein
LLGGVKFIGSDISMAISHDDTYGASNEAAAWVNMTIDLVKENKCNKLWICCQMHESEEDLHFFDPLPYRVKYVTMQQFTALCRALAAKSNKLGDLTLDVHSDNVECITAMICSMLSKNKTIQRIMIEQHAKYQLCEHFGLSTGCDKDGEYSEDIMQMLAQQLHNTNSTLIALNIKDADGKIVSHQFDDVVKRNAELLINTICKTLVMKFASINPNMCNSIFSFADNIDNRKPTSYYRNHYRRVDVSRDSVIMRIINMIGIEWSHIKEQKPTVPTEQQLRVMMNSIIQDLYATNTTSNTASISHDAKRARLTVTANLTS